MTTELTIEWNALDSEAKESTTTTTTTDNNNTITSTQDVELTFEPSMVITKEDLISLAREIVVLFMAHNAEADACDLLMEIENVELLVEYVVKDTFQRVCLYLLR